MHSPTTSYVPAMVWVASCQPVVMQTCTQSEASPLEICGGKSGKGTHFSLNSLVYILSIIPPMLQTHSSIIDTVS
jgi:hypothetical protein